MMTLIHPNLFFVLLPMASSKVLHIAFFGLHLLLLTPPSLNSVTHPFLLQTQQLRLVVSTCKVHDLVSLVLDHPTAAHLGHRMTLPSRLTWPHRRRVINTYVCAYDVCQRCKASNQSPGGLIQPIVVLDPWNIVGIDLTGPLP